MKQKVVYSGRAIRAYRRYQRLVGGVRNWPQFLAYKSGLLGQKTLVLRTRTGLSFEIPWALKFAFKDIFLHEAYTRPFIMDQLPSAPVVMDIGANAGFFSLYALHRRPSARVFSFEPLSANFQLLKRNRERNPQADWRVFQWAVSGENGTAQLYSACGNNPSTDASIRPEYERSGGDGIYSETVEVRTLENIFASQSIGRCDWLKIDCEGAEYGILYPAPAEILRRISFISMEADHLDDQTRNGAALADFLDSHGFDIYFADDAVLYAVNRH